MARIGNPAMDSVAAGDLRHRSQMERGSSQLLNAIEALRMGARFPRKSLPGKDLLWGEVPNGGTFCAVDMSETAQRQSRNVLSIMEQKDAVRALVVKRDPCAKCGVRRDIGCSHHPLSSGELLKNPDHLNAAWDRAILEARAEKERAA